MEQVFEDFWKIRSGPGISSKKDLVLLLLLRLYYKLYLKYVSKEGYKLTRFS
jgi:hypothetical protein